MQAIFLLSLFSLIFVMFSGMAAGLSKNIMQANVERIREVKEMFHDIEVVLNKVTFKTKTSTGFPIVDLHDSNLTNLSGTFLPGHLSYSKKQLEKDPWNNKIYLFKTTEKIAIWGASGGQKALAPVTTFMLVSAGPNERYDLLENLGQDPSGSVYLSKTEIQNTDITKESMVGDDIVFRFSNYEAMLDIWERTENVDIMIKNVALDYYKNLVDAFSPLIQLSHRDVNREGALKDNIFDNLDPLTGYAAFSNLEDESNKSLTNEWYKDDPANPNEIHDILISKFRTAKVYENEFVLSADATENAKLNKEFRENKYKNVKFLYPTFDALEKNASGVNLSSSSQKGLKNLGLTNIDSLDPFADLEGEVTYSYDPKFPAKMLIVRQKVGNNNEWTIIKKFEINGLGEI